MSLLVQWSHHEHTEVGQVSGHAKHGGLQVLLVTGQVDEGDDLGGALANLCPVQAAAMAVRFVHHLQVFGQNDGCSNVQVKGHIDIGKPALPNHLTISYACPCPHLNNAAQAIQ